MGPALTKSIKFRIKGRQVRALLLCVSQDFARVRDVFGENSLMGKRALFAVAGFLGLCFPLFAQQTPAPASIQLDVSALKQLGWSPVWEVPSAFGQRDILSKLNSSFFSLPSLTLSDGQLFSFFSASPWMETMPSITLPTIIVRAPQETTAWTTSPKDDPSKEVVDVERSNLIDHAGGEIGALYGSGKHGVEVERGYVIGEVGNDKFNITVGASYENSRERIPHFDR